MIDALLEEVKLVVAETIELEYCDKSKKLTNFGVRTIKIPTERPESIVLLFKCFFHAYGVLSIEFSLEDIPCQGT